MNFLVNKYKRLLEILSKNQNLVLASAIILIAFLWRIYRIDQVPQVVLPSETLLLANFKHLTLNHWIINPSAVPNSIYLYFMSLVYYFSKDILVLRIAQALLGTSSVWLFFLFVKNWFNRQTALLASLFLATSSFHLMFSRSLNEKILIIPFVVAFLYLATNALRTNKLANFLYAALIAGLSFYVDDLFIFLPIFFLIALIYFYYKNRQILVHYKNNIIASCAATLVILIPYIYFLPKFIGSISSGMVSSIGAFYLNIGAVIQTLFYGSQIRSVYGTGIEPIIDPFLMVSFAAGIFYAIFYMKRKKLMILAAWFLSFAFLISLKGQTSYSDFIYLLAPIYILASIMLDYILTNWIRTFPFNKTARILMTLIFSLFIFLSIFYNYQKYFKAWNSNLKDNIKVEYHNN